MSEEIKEIPLKERIEKLFESGWVNEFNYLESQLQEARYLVVILQQKVEQLENIRKEIEKEYNYLSQSVITDRTEFDDEEQMIRAYQDIAVKKFCIYLLNILNKGSDKE